MNRRTDHIKSETLDTQVITTKRIDLEGISLNGYVVQKILRDVQTTSNASLAVSLEEVRQDITLIRETLLELTQQISDMNYLLQLLQANTIFINQSE
jgi:hypothetical protein